MHVGETTRRVRLGLVGGHHVGNALAVVAVATELGMSLEDVCAALESAVPVSRWRMEVTERADGVTLVNDAYNANPDSMRAALTALERMGEGRRTWAVLGTMLELGDESEALHAEVGAEAVARGVDELLVVGSQAAPLAAGARAAAAARAAAGPGIRRPAGLRAHEGARGRRRRRGSGAAPATSCGPATWSCSSPAVTQVYGCSVTDWPGRRRT